MNNTEHAFLRALHSACELNQADKLDADQVNGMGAILGLLPETTAQMVERLQEVDLIKLHWGGAVSLTPKGKDHATGKTDSGSAAPVHIENTGDGVNVVVNSPGATVSAGTMGAGAVRIEGVIGDLAAALQVLRHSEQPTSPEARETKQALEQAVEATLDETQKPKPDKKTMEQHLERTTGLLAKLAKLAETARKLGPALDLIKKGYGALNVWVAAQFMGG